MRLGSVSVFRGWNPIRQSLWFVPVMCVLAGVGSSFVVLWIDGLFDYELVPRWLTGGPDAALAILSSIATSMVSLAALVLTITMVVVQLAMGQFSPRIVQTILKDKPSQLAIGVFVGTFAFAMIAMRDVLVGSSGSSGRVPGLAVVVAFILVLVSIAVLVIYVHHIGSALRVSALIELVGGDTRSLLDEHYPWRPNGVVDDAVIPANRSGVVCYVETDRLVEIAAEADCVFELVPAFGEFVPAGSPLLRVVRGDPSQIRDAAAEEIVIGLERTLGQDVSYGLRMLVDIAERSLSDSPFLDPPPPCRQSTVSTTVSASWRGGRSPTASIGTSTAMCGWSCGSWTGMRMCISHSTKSVRPGPARPRWRAVCGRRCWTSAGTRQRIGDLPWKTRWSCSTRRSARGRPTTSSATT